MTTGRTDGAAPLDAAPKRDAAAELAAQDNEPESPDEKAAAAEIATAPVAGTLVDVLRELAADDPTVSLVNAGHVTEFRAEGTAFAQLDGERATFRLRREIVSAAIRTGGSSGSPLGPDWVTFRPEQWDRYALDRVVSWWQLARRLAAEAPQTGRS